jgi:hypothetical protein
MAGQDRKYFPLGTSKPLRTSQKWRKKQERLEERLAEMLGSAAAARAYMRSRGYL